MTWALSLYRRPSRPGFDPLKDGYREVRSICPDASIVLGDRGSKRGLSTSSPTSFCCWADIGEVEAILARVTVNRARHEQYFVQARKHEICLIAFFRAFCLS